MPTAPRQVEPARIVRNPRICGGEPIVAGTRVPVRSIVLQWQHYQDLERIRSAFPRLDAQMIKVALKFYAANREEIDHLIEENEQAAYLDECVDHISWKPCGRRAFL